MVQGLNTDRTDFLSSFLRIVNFKRKILALTKIRTRVFKWLGPVSRLGGAVGSAPAFTTGDPGSSPGLGENFPLKVNNIGPIEN